MSWLYTDRTRSETVLIIMNSMGTKTKSERASERTYERTSERFAPFRMLLYAAGSVVSLMHKREWNSRVRSRGETGMSGTSATTRLTVTHFRERTKIAVSLLKPFLRRKRGGKKRDRDDSLLSSRRKISWLIGKCVTSFSFIDVHLCGFYTRMDFLLLFWYHY